MSVLFYCLFSNDEIKAVNSYPELESIFVGYVLAIIKVEMLRFICKTPIYKKKKNVWIRYNHNTHPER